MIFDTHAHYDDEAFDEDRDLLLGSLRQNGIGCVINVGASLRGARDSAALSEKYSDVYAAVGIHPDECGCMNEACMEELFRLCRRRKTVAVGEIGLDYHWNKEPKEIQKQWMIRQLELAKEVGLPINVHSRDASQDTFDIIKKYHSGTTGGVIHCYSGSVEMAREYVRMGYHIGVGGVVTFKNARVLKEVVTQLPLEYLVTETDSPYLSPEPNRGKRNDSRNISYVVSMIAHLRNADREETEERLYQNAERLFIKPAADN